MPHLDWMYRRIRRVRKKRECCCWCYDSLIHMRRKRLNVNCYGRIKIQWRFSVMKTVLACYFRRKLDVLRSNHQRYACQGAAFKGNISTNAINFFECNSLCSIKILNTLVEWHLNSREMLFKLQIKKFHQNYLALIFGSEPPESCDKELFTTLLSSKKPL